MARCRGFTLVEMVVSLVLTLIVIAAVHRLVTRTQQLSRAQVAQLSLQSNVRTGVLVSGNELRGLSTLSGGAADQNDILSMMPNAVVYRATRGIGFLCQSPAGGQLRIARSSYSGWRDPQPLRDMVYLLREGSSGTGQPDTWIALSITGVTTSVSCPGATPGITIATPAVTWPPEATAGTPVRIVEIMELKAYQSEGQWWLGIRSVSSGEAIQPLAGPLDGADGFQLTYLNRNGSPTADPSAVRNIGIGLRGVNQELRRGGTAAAVEELTTQVALYNGIHP